jgi:hypothetical protein
MLSQTRHELSSVQGQVVRASPPYQVGAGAGRYHPVRPGSVYASSIEHTWNRTHHSQVHVPVPTGIYAQQEEVSTTASIAMPVPGHPDPYQWNTTRTSPPSSYPAPGTRLERSEVRTSTAPTSTLTNGGLYSSSQQGQPPLITTDLESYMYASLAHVAPVLNTNKYSNVNDRLIAHTFQQTSQQRRLFPRQILQEAAHTHVAQRNSTQSPNETHDHQRYHTQSSLSAKSPDTP